mgnify:CR=1 FL=1
MCVRRGLVRGGGVGMEDWKVLIGERLFEESRVESACMRGLPPLNFVLSFCTRVGSSEMVIFFPLIDHWCYEVKQSKHDV